MRCRWVLLDRDGVINRDSKDYVKTRSEFQFLPKSPEAIRLLSVNGCSVIVITNQSAVGRKLTTREELQNIHCLMQSEIERIGGKITDIFFCPHRPDEMCSCRKPEPGLVFEASEKHGFLPEEACFIGDSAKDILCAKNAGCGRSILVKTGNGVNARTELLRQNVHPDMIAENLFEAAVSILED